MSKSTSCVNCSFFVANPDELVEGGSCTRFPPIPMLMPQAATILSQAGVGIAGVNPPVTEGHWCGEWIELDIVDMKNRLLDM